MNLEYFDSRVVLVLENTWIFFTCYNLNISTHRILHLIITACSCKSADDHKQASNRHLRPLPRVWAIPTYKSNPRLPWVKRFGENWLSIRLCPALHRSCFLFRPVDVMVYVRLLPNIETNWYSGYNQGQRVAAKGKMGSVAWQILTIQGDIQADMLGPA